MAGMGCSDPSVQNKMAGMGSMIKCSDLRVGDDGKLYCLCEPGQKTLCEECAKAVSLVIGDSKFQSQLNKMEWMESMTKCLAPILDPSVHHGAKNGKLCSYEECAEAKQKGENKLMCSKIQTRSQLNKMSGMESVTHCSDLKEKNGKLYYMCKQKDLMCSRLQIQRQLNKMVENKMAVMESMPDWSGLITDLLVEIATKLSLIEDFMAFRGVCTSWRAAGTKDKCVSVFKVPLLMLAEKDGDNDVREFYSLYKKKIVLRIPVPEAKGKRCIGVGFGWVLTVAVSGGELNLVKPLSSAKIQLPNMMTFPDYEEFSTGTEESFMRYAALSANPSETPDFMLMVAVNLNMGFWRNGDNHWTKLEITGINSFPNIGYYKHKMYAIDHRLQVWMWDPCDTQAPQVIFTLHEDWRQYFELAYFVESSNGDLLLLFRNGSYHQDPEYYELDFWIMQIDTVNKGYVRINSLGQDAVFVGQNRAVSVVADDFPGVIKANCIYFTDNDFEQFWDICDGGGPGGAEMGIYNVEDDSIETFGVESLSSVCPPFWIFPSF